MKLTGRATKTFRTVRLVLVDEWVRFGDWYGGAVGRTANRRTVSSVAVDGVEHLAATGGITMMCFYPSSFNIHVSYLPGTSFSVECDAAWVTGFALVEVLDVEGLVPLPLVPEATS